MEYHNYNTPLDRVDEDFIKQILAGEFDSSCGCERGHENSEQHNNDYGCASRAGVAKTCRYNRRYLRRNCGRSTADNVSERNDRSSGCSKRDARNEDDTSGNNPCNNGCNNVEHDIICGCGDCVNFKPPVLHGVPHSMVYSPHQDFEGIYECDEALRRGTIFRCLDFPFAPTPCNCRRCNEENKGCR